ncbi:MAG: M67 family metallopeptidase [Saprospiraceae bacterium]|jgi:proteasome lid subunit RPN8/RPN11|nr:M67 family metallopeptidase [Saprospiraceae bacterium]
MSNLIVKLSEETVEVINADGICAFPNECCGFLYGTESASGERQITLAVPVTNSKEGDQRRRFEISPLDYLRAEQYALQNDTALLGVYHSHPNHPAIASEHDLAVAMPYFSYVIVSVMQGEIADHKSWRLQDEERVFVEEKVYIVSESSVLNPAS